MTKTNLIQPIEQQDIPATLEESLKIARAIPPTPKRKPKDKNKDNQEQETNTQPPNIITHSDDWLTLENITCYNQEGKVTEHYTTLSIATQPAKDNQGKLISATPYQAAKIAKTDKNTFNPSSALTCTILATLYHQKSNSTAKLILDQYKDKGNGNGWHTLNTIIKYNQENSKIIHYPNTSDFPDNKGTQRINTNQKTITQPFNPATFADQELRQALNSQDTELINFIHNFTGLKDPEILIQIARYYQKTPKIWFLDNPSTTKTTRGSWLGCGGNGFDLYVCSGLGDTDALRRVHKNFST
jgi:hypothetical protein